MGNLRRYANLATQDFRHGGPGALFARVFSFVRRRFYKALYFIDHVSAEVEFVNLPTEFAPACRYFLQLRIRNLGFSPWNSGRRGSPPFAAGLFVVKGADVVHPGPHSLLPADIPAGSSVEVSVILDTPAKPGEYTLRCDLVRENCYWFHELGAIAEERTIRVAQNQVFLKAGEKYYCRWPWETIVLMSDGTTVCGCADPFKKRPTGNAGAQTASEIWNGKVFHQIREGLRSNDPQLCSHCPLMQTAPEDVPLPEDQPGRLPERLFVEPCVSCNLSCYKASCNHENGIHSTRSERLLSWDTYTRVIDELGPTLRRIDFFNYGESFIHPRAIEMIHYAKSRYPHIYFFGSTNGLRIDTEEKRRALVRSGMDEITFSIDGASQQTYEIYRRGGDFRKVLHILEQLVMVRQELGSQTPYINWRYILFRWNDSDEEMERARLLAARVGVDRFCWETTRHPPDSASLRFVPGNPEYESIRSELWTYSGNALAKNRE